MSGVSGNDAPPAGVFLKAGSGGKKAAHSKGTGLVAVVGAGGPTGLECVRLLREQGTPVRAVVRSPDKYAEKLAGVDLVAGDVTNVTSLTAAFASADAVVFAASASSYSGTGGPYQVDYLGVVNTVAAAKATDVRQIVLVSSRLVNPANRWHPIRLLLNNIRWNLMDYKYEGEQALRTSGVPYTIVRPGGLTGGEGQRVGGPPKTDYILAAPAEGPLEGATSIHRADVAAVVCEALRAEAAQFKTIEVVARSRREDDPPFEERLHALFPSLAKEA